MKNNDKTIPYEPTLAELDRFQIRVERTTLNSFAQDEEDENMAGNLNATNSVALAMLAVLVVVLIVIMIGVWNSPLPHAIVSWNG
jgi:hypothetical protein